MLKSYIILVVGFLFWVAGATAEELSLERQRQIIERYMYVTGQSATRPAALGAEEGEPGVPEKCGTPAILDFHRNYDRLDRRLLAALGVQDVLRPTKQAEYGVPGGHTLIHYDTTGEDIVWQADIDRNHDGVPDYVEVLALIADSCYDHIVDSLGYPVPLTDSLCLNGGDGRVDIYLDSLGYGYYGMTHNQAECYEPDVQHEASWIVIDRDFQRLPGYVGRPLDAARVTLAHELFHTIHFTLDATEHVSWFEMSSVWMEEEIYDEINDYYLYDYVFFDRPWTALHDTIIVGHMYQSVIFPIYLSEKYGRGVIKAIWERSGALGPGSHFLQAFDYVIDSASTDPANAQYECLCYNQDSTICLDQVLITEDLSSAFAEFAVWNFFTGPYADQAPDGIGYSEAEHYDYIPMESMDLRRHYPLTVGYADNRFEPQPNAAFYLRLENLQSVNLDTLLTLWFSPDPDAIVEWGVTGIFQMENDPDSHLVVSETVDVWETWICTDWNDTVCLDSIQVHGRYLGEIIGNWVCTDGEFGHDPIYCDISTCSDSVKMIDLRPYRSLTVILTPTSFSTGPYAFGDVVEFRFSVFDSTFVVQSLVDLPPAVLTPYPNPAIVGEMGGNGLTFRFQAPTDTTSFPIYSSFLLHLDLFTVAGELIKSVEHVYAGEDREGPRPGGVFEIDWDMKNQAGKDVASGVYLAVARLYEGVNKNVLLVVDQTKVAVIR